jgi:hypothetical protein
MRYFFSRFKRVTQLAGGRTHFSTSVVKSQNPVLEEFHQDSKKETEHVLASLRKDDAVNRFASLAPRRATTLGEEKMVYESKILESKGGFAKIGLASEAKTQKRFSKDEIEKEITEIFKEMADHPASNPRLFKMLEDIELNAKQAKILRNNYFARTRMTIPGIMQTMQQSLKRGNYEAFAKLSKSLIDEAGEGNPAVVHPKLLEDAFNMHMETVFGIDPVTIVDVTKPHQRKHLTEQTIQYLDFQKKVSRSSEAAQVAVNAAKEQKADDMLKLIRKAVFEPYRGYHSPTEYEKITRYFVVHYDPTKEGGDVEKQHSIDAKAAMVKILTEARNQTRTLQVMRYAAIKCLDVEAAFFNGLEEAINDTKTKGQPIPKKRNFVAETSSVRTAVSDRVEQDAKQSEPSGKIEPERVEKLVSKDPKNHVRS